MTASFICPTCGESHDGSPTEYGWQLPYDVWIIPASERQDRAKFSSDICQLGNRFFIRCLLKIPFNELPGHYGRGIWVEVAEPCF